MFLMKSKKAALFPIILLLILCGCQNTEPATSASTADPEVTASVPYEEATHTIQAYTEIPNQDIILPASYVGATWQEAYRKLICSNPASYLTMSEFTPIINGGEVFFLGDDINDRWLYLGIHDFDADGIPELIIGDSCTLAVFTYRNGEAEKIADIDYPNEVWCVNGLYFSGNCMSALSAGSGGIAYVSFGFLDNQYVLGRYNEQSCSDVIINGEKSTLEELNRIYTTNFEEIAEEEYRMRLHLVYDGENWILEVVPGNKQIVDAYFDFDLIMWE